ncbi:MAG: chromate transporter [Firmicutes bacterium HGW-Firmicutes-21]|nr:MAG: chromate transporter [Firmicutes bacterium HGW-Firmicutes-21]
MKRDFKFYIKLFVSCFELSAFTFGGGYVIVSLMRKKFVNKLGWLEDSEMIDFTAMAQSSPGAIAVNAAFLIGFKLAGALGAAITVLATILPPLIILYTVSFGYEAFRDNTVVQSVFLGMRAGVAAVIADVVISMAQSVFKNKAFVSVGIAVSAFVAVAVFSVSVIIIIPVCGFLGFLLYSKKDEEVGKQ